jgi:predicted O-linked N-acetylglucosamine transferase (SPINDLY family)
MARARNARVNDRGDAPSIADSASTAARHVAAGFELHRTGDIDAAARAYERALAVAPDHGDARYLLALVEMSRGRFEVARGHIRSAVRADPANAHYLFADGEIARGLNDIDGAIRAFEAAVAIDASDAQRWAQLGDLHLAAGCPVAAERDARLAIKVDPALQNAWHLLGESLRAQARSTQALECYKEAMRLAGVYGPAAESFLMTLNFSDAVTPSAVAAEHRRIGGLVGAWGERGEADAPWRVDPAALSGRRPLRVGYVSPDFGMHVVSFFIEPVLAAHDRGSVEVFCYFAAPGDDAQSARVKAHSPHWRSLVDLDDRAAAELIRADGLDVAVDLSGHTRGNRLAMFARRVAPVQATWLGYPNTTGVPSIDYRLTDSYCDPPGGTDPLHSERLWRLDGGFLAYRPRPEAPPVTALPARDNGYITFGCFNYPAKITDTCLRLWAQLLDRVGGARLLLKGKGFDEPQLALDLLERFKALGGDSTRVELHGGRSSFVEHLSCYGMVDIALDTYPYHGTTTTCEALMMGVPVVSLAGLAHASRVGASLLPRAGYPEWVATSEEEYVAIAAAMAADVDGLARIRSELRWKLSCSALGGVTMLAKALEAAYRAMIREVAERR